MKHQLFIVEGMPCCGKSTLSAFLAEVLSESCKVCYVDEGTGQHPADYEFHAYIPAEEDGGVGRIVALCDCSEEERNRLMPNKIYDGLPWKVEMPLMLDKWRQFVTNATPDTTYVFNCVLLQNPMCETMMRFGFPEETSLQYIQQLAEIIQPLNPVVIYLENNHIAEAVQKAAPERPGWLDAVIAYHNEGKYGQSISAQGFDGYIACLKERQRRELRILEKLPLTSYVLEDPQLDWQSAREKLRGFISQQLPQ
ncbi:MAG: hypothetical protein IKC28_05855 [Clostridia bacterium]|nr:hypothetical protein [Clostridia bacterium]